VDLWYSILLVDKLYWVSVASLLPLLLLTCCAAGCLLQVAVQDIKLRMGPTFYVFGQYASSAALSIHAVGLRVSYRSHRLLHFLDCFKSAGSFQYSIVQQSHHRVAVARPIVSLHPNQEHQITR
jgi:hypothetical protein